MDAMPREDLLAFDYDPTLPPEVVDALFDDARGEQVLAAMQEADRARERRLDETQGRGDDDATDTARKRKSRRAAVPTQAQGTLW